MLYSISGDHVDVVTIPYEGDIALRESDTPIIAPLVQDTIHGAYSLWIRLSLVNGNSVALYSESNWDSPIAIATTTDTISFSAQSLQRFSLETKPNEDATVHFSVYKESLVEGGSNRLATSSWKDSSRFTVELAGDANTVIVYNNIEQKNRAIDFDIVDVELSKYALYAVRFNDTDATAEVQYISIWDTYVPVKITSLFEMVPPEKKLIIRGVDIGSLSPFSVWADIEVSDSETGTVIDMVSLSAPKPALDSPRTIRYVDCLQPIKIRTTILSRATSPVIMATDTVIVDARIFCRAANKSDDCFCETLCESAGDGNGDGLVGYDDPDCSRSDILQFLTVKNVSADSYQPHLHGISVNDRNGSVLMNVIKHTIPSSSCARLAASTRVEYSDYIDKGKAGRVSISITSPNQEKWNSDMDGKRWRWSLSTITETNVEDDDYGKLLRDKTQSTMDYYYTTGQTQLPEPIVFFVDFSKRYYCAIILTSVVNDENGREIQTVTDDKCEVHVPPFTTQPDSSITLLLPLHVFSKSTSTSPPVIIFSISTSTPISYFDSDARASFLAVTSTHTQHPGIYIVRFVAMLAINETEFTLTAKLSAVRKKSILVTTTRSDNIFLRPLTTAIISTQKPQQAQLYSCGASETTTVLSVVNPTPLKYRVLLDGLQIHEGGPHEQKMIDVKIPTRALTTNGIYVALLEVLYSMDDIDDIIQRKLDVLANRHHVEVLPHIQTSVRLEAVEQVDQRMCDGMVRALFSFPDGGIGSPVHYFSANDADIGNTRLYDRVEHYIHRDRDSAIIAHAYLASNVGAGYNMQCTFYIDTRPLKSAWTVIAPKVNAELSKSTTSYTGNSITISVGSEVIDMVSLSGPDGIVAIRRQPQPYSSHTFSKLAYGSYIVSWQSEYNPYRQQEAPLLVCEWNKIAQISFPAESSIVTQVSSGEERIMCPYSFFNSANIWHKYWTLTLTEDVVKNPDQYSVSVDLWDIDRQTRIMLDPEEGSDKRLYSHMLAHPGSYSADILLALYDANGNAKTSAVFSTPVYTVQQPLFTEESFEIHFTNPRCIYSNDGVVDLSYPPELLGNVKTRIKSCVPLLNGTSSCSGARVTDNLRITGIPFCRELVLEYTIFHGCRFTKTFSLFPVSATYPMLAGISPQVTCDGDYIFTAMVHNFFEQTMVPLRVDNRYATVEWRYGQDAIGNSAQIHVPPSRLSDHAHGISVSVSTAGGCRTDAVIQRREIPQIEVVDIEWGEILPIYCPGEHDASLSVDIPIALDKDTTLVWTLCVSGSASSAALNGTAEAYDNCAEIPNYRNKRRVDNLSPGLYRVTATRQSTTCSKTLETIVAEKTDYHVKNFIEVDYGDNMGSNSVRIAATGDAPIEFSSFTASMLSVDDRKYLSRSSVGTPVLTNVPSLHEIKIDIPQPDKYRRYTRMLRCSKPLTINIWRASSFPRLIDPSDLSSPYSSPFVEPITVLAGTDITRTLHMSCFRSPPPPANVTVYNKRSNTTIMTATIVAQYPGTIPLVPTVEHAFAAAQRASFREIIGEDSYRIFMDSGALNKSISIANVTKMTILAVVKITAMNQQTLCNYYSQSRVFDCAPLYGFRELAVTYAFSDPRLSDTENANQQCREFMLLGQAGSKLSPREMGRDVGKVSDPETAHQYAIVPADMPLSLATTTTTTRVHKTHEMFVWYRLLTTIKDIALPRPRIYASTGKEVDEQCLWKPINVFPWVYECLLKLLSGENYKIDTGEEYEVEKATEHKRASYRQTTPRTACEIRASNVQGDMNIMTQVTVPPTTSSACNGVVSVSVYGGLAPYYMTTSRNNGQNNDARESQNGKFYIDKVCEDTFTVSVRDSVYGVDEWSTSIVQVTSHNSFSIDSVSIGLAEGCGLDTTANVTVGFLETLPVTIGVWDAYHYPTNPLIACTDVRMEPANRLRIGGNFYSLKLTLGNWSVYACDRTGNIVSTETSVGMLDLTIPNVPVSVQIFHGNVCIPDLGGQTNIEQWNLPHLLVHGSTPPLALYDESNMPYIDTAVENVTDVFGHVALEMQIRGLPLGSSSWWLWDSRKCPTEIVIVNRQLPAGICGTCNESDTRCFGCDGVAWSRTTTDICGACGGTNACLHDCEFDGSMHTITQRQSSTEASECTQLLGYNNMVFTVPVTTFGETDSVPRTTIQRLIFTAGLTVPQGIELLIEDSTVNNFNISNSTHMVITGGQMRHVLRIHTPQHCTNHTMNLRMRDVDIEGLEIRIYSTSTCRPLVRIRLRFIAVSLLKVFSDTNVDFIIGDSNITRLEFSGDGNVDLNTTTQYPNSNGEYPYRIDTIDINKEATIQHYKLMGCRILLKTRLVGKVTFGDRFTVQYRERQCAVDMSVVLTLKEEDGIPVDYRDPFDYYDVGDNIPIVSEEPTKAHEQNLFTIVMFMAFFIVLLVILFLYLVLQIR